MSKCKGSCNSCGDKKTEKATNPNIGFPLKKDVDIEYFLKPLPKQEKDDTSLFKPCKCDWNNGKTKRYMCLPCIKTWVEAVDNATAKGMVALLKEMGKNVAAERVELLTKEKKWKEPIDVDSTSHVCSCGCGGTTSGKDNPTTGES